MTKRLSRRAALAGLAAAVPVAAASPALGAAVADADLMALDEELDACLVEYANHERPEDDPFWDEVEAAHPEWKDLDAEHMDYANARFDKALDAIMAQRPATFAGLAVVVRAAEMEIEMYGSEPSGDFADEGSWVLFKLCESIRAYAKAAGLDAAALHKPVNERDVGTA